MAELNSASTLSASWSESPADTDLTQRILRLLNFYRLAIALVLLTMFFVSEEPRMVGRAFPTLFYSVLVFYLLFAVAVGFFLGRKSPGHGFPLHAQLFIDIGVIAALLFASGGISSGLGGLLFVSVGAASIIVSGRSATMFAAAATLAILTAQFYGQIKGITTQAELIPTGVLGAVFFLTAAAGNFVARRMRETEALAKKRGVDLANLAELNEYIIQHLRESLVVIDRDNRIRLMNESAAHMLGLRTAMRDVTLNSVSARLAGLASTWREDAEEVPSSQSTFMAADGSTLVTPHFAPLGAEKPSAALIFLEDSSLMAERVQQSKLAALGRLSASIAHEIRNPVGAMSHAGQLLAESPRIGSEEERLVSIMTSNAARVSKIISNVLQLSRREETKPEVLDLDVWLEGFVTEFRESQIGEKVDVITRTQEPSMSVRVDPSHLHQIVWNLFANAVRYASDELGRCQIELVTDRLQRSGRPFLGVSDRGPGINPEVADEIFEPFFTGASGGTGLGLFIARELCECNRATLVYEPRPGGGSSFRIVFADPTRWQI